MPALWQGVVHQAVDYCHLQRTADLLLKNSWRFAKTMPDNPHWYTLRKTWAQDDEFVHCTQFIRDYGYREKYGGRWYTVLNINDMKYWTMGAPIPQTTLINRKYINVDYVFHYDEIADTYDCLFTDEQSEQENAEVFAMLEGMGGRVLDVGCGTGLLLDGLPVPPADYVGIDPSTAMLDRFRAKRPDYGASLMASRFEDHANGKYDSIICLFGSASYIHPPFIPRIEQMLTQGGRYFLMFFKPGYQPVTHIKTGIHPPFYQNGWEQLTNPVISEYHNFIIARGQA